MNHARGNVIPKGEDGDGTWDGCSKRLNDDECLVSRASTRPFLGFARSPAFINYAPDLIDVHRAFDGYINYERERAAVSESRKRSGRGY